MDMCRGLRHPIIGDREIGFGGYGIFAPMSQDTVLLDANVLYPAPLRDLLLQLAVMGM